VVKIVKFDKRGAPVRDPKTNEIQYVDRVFLPSERALQFELDRLDDQRPLAIADAAEQLQVSPESLMTDEEKVRAAAAQIDLFRAALEISFNLGMPLPSFCRTPAIEVSATKVEPEPGATQPVHDGPQVPEPEPQPVAELVASERPEGPEPPAEPAKPKPPSVDEAF
jgi:hypothetical protein